MKTKLLSLWESIHTSFWFLPTLMSMAAIGLSYTMVRLDQSLSVEALRLGDVFYPGGPEGARLLLSTIAGSTITVSGVTFSITIAALTMASSQFGPRLLRGFMADKSNQLVLGTFIGTFIYCLLVLRTVQDNSTSTFVPEIAVTFGMVLALISFGILIYFFHHVTASLRPEQLVSTVYHEFIQAIDAAFPAEPKPPLPGMEEEVRRQNNAGERARIMAESSGYLKAIDVHGLLALATDEDLAIHLAYRPGDFVFEQTPLAIVVGRGDVDPRLRKRVQRAFILGSTRSLEQDVEFPVQQLVDMALRALSPSLNDPYTAVNCIDRLGSGICHLNSRYPSAPYRCDKQGKLRLVLDVYTYEGIVDAAFNQIRQSAQDSVGASIRLLETLQAIAMTARSEEQRKAIRRHAEMIHRAGREPLTEKRDRDDLDDRYQAVMRKLGDGAREAI